MAPQLMATTPASGVAMVSETPSFAVTRADLEKSLTGRGVIGAMVRVMPPRYRDLAMTVTIGIKPEYRQTLAVAAVKKVLLNKFAYSEVDFNMAVRPQEILASLTELDELAYADVALRPSVGDSGTTSLIQAASDEIVRLLDENLVVLVDAAQPGIPA